MAFRDIPSDGTESPTPPGDGRRAPGRDRRGSDRVARTVGSAGVALAVTLAMATVVSGSTASAAAAELPLFDDCRTFTAHMAKLAEPEVTAYGLGGGSPLMYRRDAGGVVAPEAAGAAPAADAKSAPTAAVGNGPTGTNVQERGVDEPDMTKIDGDRVVTLSNGRLVVVDASTKKPKVLGSLTFPQGQYPNELLVLGGHRALVLGTAWETRETYDQTTGNEATADAAPAGKMAPGFAPQQYSTPQVVLTLVDLTGKNPAVLRTEKITGSYVSARLTDGVARIVMTSQPRIQFSAPRENEPESLALARNKAAVRKAKAADWLPARQILNAAGKVLSSAPLFGCHDVRHPADASGLGIISVLTLDTERGSATFDKARGNGIVGNGELVYSSANRLYVATTEGGWNNPRPMARNGSDSQHTKIHAFDVTGRSASPYVGTGAVPGYLLGRWAFSEHDGYLRVATTTGPPWATNDGGPVSQSSVIVLAEKAKRLVPVGSVSGMGKGERIRAVRWFDDLAAVVTFRQTDPLYLVDLSVPTKPKVRGELKVPGYSAYLHPVGDDHILGVGQDADSTGRTTGLQVSSFDVSNTAKPSRTDKVGLGQGYTDVEHDSRAFTYLPNRRLAILPAWVMEQVSCPPNAQCMATSGPVQPEQPAPGSGQGFVGQIQVPAAIGITVDKDGDLHRAGRFIGDSAVMRILPIGDRLVAITATSVVVLDPKNLKQLGFVRTAPDYNNTRMY